MAAKKKGKAPDEEIPQEESPIEESSAGQTAEAEIQEPEAEVIEVEAENTVEQELLSEKGKYLRLAAEYDNFRKRSSKERETIYSDVRSDTVLKFLPVYDNLSRALDQATEDEAYKKGVEMTMTQLKEILEKLGVAEIPAVGETFNPDVHNAVMHIDDEEKGESEIVEEFQKGFKLGDKVIRFSMVKVAN